MLDLDWYMSQIKFAENYMKIYIAKYRLDGSKFEPEKPGNFERSLRTPLQFHDWIQNINDAMLEACLEICHLDNAKVPLSLEMYAPGIRHASIFKRGLAFDYNPHNTKGLL